MLRFFREASMRAPSRVIPLLIGASLPRVAEAVNMRVNDDVDWEATTPASGQYDVFMTGDVLWLDAACDLEDAGATTARTTTASGGAYLYEWVAADPAGTWSITCGATTFSVVKRDHVRLWLDFHGPDDLVAGLDQDGLTFSHYERDPGGVYDGQRVPDYDTADPWVRSTAWDTILDRYVCSYQAEDGVAAGVTDYDPLTSCSTTTLFAPTSGTTGATNLLDSTDGADVRKFARALEHLAMANLVGRAAYEAGFGGSTSNAAPAADNYSDGTYPTALTFWGQALVDFAGTSGWSASWSGTCLGPGLDVCRSENLAALAIAYDWGYPDLTLAQRRAWADRLYAEAAALRADEDDSASDTDWPDLTASPYPNHAERQLRNGHYLAPAYAVGLVADVLYGELTPSATDRDALRDWSVAFFTDHLSVLGDDGADSSGSNYALVDLRYVLRWIEAERLVEADAGIDVSADYWGVTGWFARRPAWALGRTHLLDATANDGGDGRHALLGDATPYDDDYPSGLYARIADELAATDAIASEIAQRAAWDGPSNHVTAQAVSPRWVEDLLWWNDTLPLAGDAADLPRHACHADTGEVVLRAGWDLDDPHLVFHGGSGAAGHEHPDVGAFDLWADGHLVQVAGTNTTAKRTVTGSTFLVNGHGQHSDGWGLSEAVPEGSDNAARLTTYLDASGTIDAALSTATIDVVTFCADLTPLYRTDDADDLRAGGPVPAWVTDVDGPDASPKLTDLSRCVVWVGDATPDDGSGAIFLHDRMKAQDEASFELDWRLVVSDRTADGDRPACVAASSGGYWTYNNRAGAAVGLKFTDGAIDWGGTASYTRADVNDNWAPDMGGAGPDCAGTFISGSGTAYTSTPAHVSVAGHGAGGELSVRSFGSGASFLSTAAVAGGDGGDLLGYALRREQSGQDRVFITALLPIVDPADEEATPITEYITGVLGGSVLRTSVHPTVAADAYDVTLFLRDATSSVVTDGWSTSTARIGVVVRAATNPDVRLAAQIVVGSSLVHRGTPLITVTDGAGLPRTASVSVTRGENAAFGTITTHGPTPTRVTLRMPPATVYAGTPSVTYTGASVAHTWDAVNRDVTLTVDGDGDFRITFDHAAAGAVVYSTCTP